MNRHALWSHITAVIVTPYNVEDCHQPTEQTCYGPGIQDPPDAQSPYAKPYDDALAGHLRLRVALGRATEATNDLGIALRDINAN